MMKNTHGASGAGAAEWQAAVNDDEAFVSSLAQAVRSRSSDQAHPSEDDLHRCVQRVLDRQHTVLIREHLSHCATCQAVILRFQQAETELAESLMGWIDLDPSALLRMLVFELQRPLLALNFARIDSLSRDLTESLAQWETLRQIFSGILRGIQPDISETRLRHCVARLNSLSSLCAQSVNWISSLWTPLYVGQTMTAADLPAQEHVFALDEGAIKLTCVWQPQFRKKPAHIGLTWSADLKVRSDLSAMFIRLDDPQNAQVEVPLGKELRGDTIITSRELGFDPSRERWAIALILRNNERSSG